MDGGMVRSLFKARYIITCNSRFEVIRDGAVIVEDGKITYVGKGSDLEGCQRYFDFVVDERYGIMMPGLVNCHTHAAMSLFKGVSDDASLREWLEQTIWPLESKVDSESLLYGNYVAMMEMLCSGTTTFADFYFFDELIKALKVVPMRSIATLALLDKVPDGEVYWSRLKKIGTYVDAVNSLKDGLVGLALGPHSVYTCSEALLLEVAKLSSRLSLPIHIHLSETKEEIDLSIKEHGVSPVKYLNNLGFLNEKVFAAHCIHLNEEDVNILADMKVSCVHDPSSNLKLGSGIMPLSELLRKGINVCLGTDGSASSNSLNILAEMRLAVLLQRGLSFDPTFPTAKDALLMATKNGAYALGLGDRVGSIEVGKDADLVILEGRSPRLLPEHNIISNIVYSSQPGDVIYTIVDGRIMYDRGRFIGLDSESILDVFGERAAKLLGC
ncbi:MAG: amidohydrolase family protein [Nitrososphaeria archaeon]